MGRISRRKYPWLFNYQEGKTESLLNKPKHLISSIKVHNISVKAFPFLLQNVTYVSETFIRAAIDNSKPLLGLEIKEGGYHILSKSGNHSYVVVYNNGIYINSYRGNYMEFSMEVQQKTGEIQKLNLAISKDQFLSKEAEIESYILDKAAAVFAILLFKQYAKIESKVLPAKGKLADFHCKYKNDCNMPVDLCDLNWYTKSLQSHPFIVRGHWRRQPCGPGRSQVRLIHIDPFTKNGYTKGAYKQA